MHLKDKMTGNNLFGPDEVYILCFEFILSRRFEVSSLSTGSKHQLYPSQLLFQLNDNLYIFLRFRN